MKLVLEERKAKEVLLELEARHADILRLETNVRELHQIFLYTAMLVEEQVKQIFIYLYIIFIVVVVVCFLSF